MLCAVELHLRKVPRVEKGFFGLLSVAPPAFWNHFVNDWSSVYCYSCGLALLKVASRSLNRRCQTHGSCFEALRCWRKLREGPAISIPRPSDLGSQRIKLIVNEGYWWKGGVDLLGRGGWGFWKRRGKAKAEYLRVAETRGTTGRWRYNLSTHKVHL